MQFSKEREERIKRVRTKKNIPDVTISIPEPGVITIGQKNTITASAEPSRFIRYMEVTVADPLQREKVLRCKKIGKGKFELRYKPPFPGKYTFSFYARGKYNIFQRTEISTYAQETIENSGEKAPEKKASVNKLDRSKIVKRSWPSSSAYGIALQNPTANISEKYDFLRKSVFEKNPNVKYPTLIFGSGNFGSVFKVKTSDGYRALKCFTRGSADLELRYMGISESMKRVNLPFFTEFRYLNDSVRVMSNKDTYFPTVMMAWVEGENLNSFISKNLKNRELLEKTAENIVNAVKEMVKNGIAHGDLSGDNILVAGDGSVKIIDYDGMFVPEISELGASESGHESFQHPKRTRIFDQTLDYFSCLLIYVSLLAISRKPEIWEYNDDDGDKLIISADDLKNPQESKIFKEMGKLGGKIKKLTELLKESLNKDSNWEGISPLKL